MPYTGIVLAILAFHAAAFLILLGHWVAAAGMFPQATKAFADEYDRRPVRAALVGIFTFGPLLLLVLQAGKLPGTPLRLLIIAAGFAALLVALVGSSGLAWRIGRNLSVSEDAWSPALRGGVMLALVFITPLLGSLFLLPIGLASGFGVVLLARPWKSKAPALAPEIVAVAPDGAAPSLT